MNAPRSSLAALVLCTSLMVFTTQSTTASSAQASIRVSPEIGPPTTSVTVSGSGFGVMETVLIRFGATPLARARTSQSGAFARRIEVPEWASPGDHVVRARGKLSGRSASASFLVRTDWPDVAFDPANSAFNSYENVLNVSNVGGLEPEWSKETNGKVVTGPTVAGGLVYAASYDHYLYALDPNSGTIVWKFDAGALAYSPTVGDGRVYLWAAGEVIALDAVTGSSIWQVPSVVTPGVEVDGVLYLANAALDAATGAQLWSATVPVLFGPAVVDGMVYASGTDGHLYALDAATGSVAWSADAGGSFVPEVAGGIVYGETGRDLLAFDANTGGLVWTADLGGDVGTNGPAVGWGVVYGRTRNERITALDAVTGRTLWSVQLPGGDSSGDTIPAVANGVLYTADGRGTLYALDAATGSTLFSSANGRPISSPVVVNGKVYFTSVDSAVHALGLPTTEAAGPSLEAGHPSHSVGRTTPPCSSRPNPGLWATSQTWPSRSRNTPA
jgi:outer membrane protein assembly factor BamB